MKTLISLIAVVIGCGNVFSQLSGSAFLNGQADHSGIKVSFIAGGPTSVSDSAFTASDGSYTINISGGIYKVVFSKSGYQSVYYSNNESMILTNTVTLGGALLYPGKVVNVAGNVSGTWTADNIYVVTSNISIPPAGKLVIQPGTVVKFNGSYSLTADGILQAVGNPSARIVFTSNKVPSGPGQWGGINVNNTGSQISDCLIEYGKHSIWIANSSPAVKDCEIRRFQNSGIILHANSSSLIRNNVIHEFNGDNSYGINTYGSSAIIECNQIYDGSGAGIVSGDGSSIINNVIYNIMAPQNGQGIGHGIDCYAFSTSLIRNNFIHHCSSGISIGENIQPGPSPKLLNNTITDNFCGIKIDGMIASPSIIGNIIANNEWVFQRYDYPWNNPSGVSHNLFWNNAHNNLTDVYLAWLGLIVNTNTNGDSVDSYYNLFIDPLFQNNTAPVLNPASPCLKAGDPVYSPDIGCNPGQMCSGMILGVGNYSEAAQLKLYPNPFNDYLTIQTPESFKRASVSVYDLTGREAKPIVVETEGRSLTLNTKELAPGIYILKVKLDADVRSFKVIRGPK